MADLNGSETIEIDAPIERVFEIAADIERAPEWQGAMKSARATTRDADGRPELVETEIDASVATVSLVLRFTYDAPTSIRWTRDAGDLKSLEGSWRFEDLGGDRTRATYSLDIGLNRRYSLVAKTIKGPVESRVRNLLARRPVEGLKGVAEGA